MNRGSWSSCCEPMVADLCRAHRAARGCGLDLALNVDMLDLRDLESIVVAVGDFHLSHPTEALAVVVAAAAECCSKWDRDCVGSRWLNASMTAPVP